MNGVRSSFFWDSWMNLPYPRAPGPLGDRNSKRMTSAGGGRRRPRDGGSPRGADSSSGLPSPVRASAGRAGEAREVVGRQANEPDGLGLTAIALEAPAARQLDSDPAPVAEVDAVERAQRGRPQLVQDAPTTLSLHTLAQVYPEHRTMRDKHGSEHRTHGLPQACSQSDIPQRRFR